MRRLVVFAVSYLAVGAATLAAALWFGLGSLNLPAYRRLAAGGVRVDATVTSTDCGNHNAVRYRFTTAGGRPVDGAGTPGDGNPPCRSLRPGGSVAVWYVPGDPTVNAPGDPAVRPNGELTSVRVAAFGASGLLVGSEVTALLVVLRSARR